MFTEITYVSLFFFFFICIRKVLSRHTRRRYCQAESEKKRGEKNKLVFFDICPLLQCTSKIGKRLFFFWLTKKKKNIRVNCNIIFFFLGGQVVGVLRVIAAELGIHRPIVLLSLPTALYHSVYPCRQRATIHVSGSSANPRRGNLQFFNGFKISTQSLRFI